MVSLVSTATSWGREREKDDPSSPFSSSEYGECSKDARGRGAIVGEVEGAGVSMMSARSARRLTFGKRLGDSGVGIWRGAGTMVGECISTT